MPPPLGFGRLHHRALGAIPLGLWVPSPWPRSPCDRRGQASAGRRSGLWSRSCSWGERGVPSPPGFVPVPGAGTFHCGNRSPSPLGTQRTLGTALAEGCRTPIRMRPQGMPALQHGPDHRSRGGCAPPSPKRAPRQATCGDPEGHGGHLSLLRLPHAGSGYGPNCSSWLEEMPSALADRWPLLMHDALAGDGCA